MRALVLAPHAGIWVHSFPEALIAEVLDKVDRYRQELFADLMRRQEGKTDEAGIVMQINFQAFPLMDSQRTQS